MPTANRQRRATGREPDIPLSAFSDIAFLLIIFFILVTSLSSLTGLNTELPSAAPSETRPEKTPTVHLGDGRMRFGDREVTLPGLRDELAALALPAQPGEKRIVLIEATGPVPYQQYYDVLAAISGAGGIVGILREDSP